jgi:hypothetical protein
MDGALAGFTRRTLAPALAITSMPCPRTISVHVPKAAGSSLHAQFTALLGDEAVHLDLAHDPFSGRGEEPATFPPGARIVHGHFAARRYAGSAACWITFLRHPIDNVFSNFAYWKLVNAPALGIDVNQFPSVVDFASFPGQSTLFSEAYFGGFDMRRFDFIGFHETRAVDMQHLGRLLGLKLDAGVHINKTPAYGLRTTEEANPAIRARLTDILAPDIRFYEKWRGAK